MRQITEEQVVAAMRAVEEETIRRCAALARDYAKSKGHPKPSSRIAAAKAMGAQELAARIENLPRKEIK